MCGVRGSFTSVILDQVKPKAARFKGAFVHSLVFLSFSSWICHFSCHRFEVVGYFILKGCFQLVPFLGLLLFILTLHLAMLPTLASKDSKDSPSKLPFA